MEEEGSRTEPIGRRVWRDVDPRPRHRLRDLGANLREVFDLLERLRRRAPRRPPRLESMADVRLFVTVVSAGWLTEFFIGGVALYRLVPLLGITVMALSVVPFWLLYKVWRA